MRPVIVLALAIALWTPISRGSGLEVQSWKYDPEAKVLWLKLVNVSGKDITAYNFSVTLKFADGSTDALADGSPSWGHGIDLLASLIFAEMAKGTSDEKLAQQIAPGFTAGTSRSEFVPLPLAKDVVDVKTVFDIVIYADGTAEAQDEQHFKALMARRKGGLLAMQKINEVIRQTLADPTITDPSKAAKVELTRLILTEAEKHYDPEEPECYQPMLLRNAIPALQNMTDRKSLERFVEDNDKRIAFTLPHTQITKVP